MKLLRGIKGFSWSDWEKNTFICAVVRIVNYLEEYLTYDYLMGISGAAFRFHIHKRGWSVFRDGHWTTLAPDATMGFSCGETSLQRLGFRYHFLQSIKRTKEFTHHQGDVDTMMKQIKNSIDRGYPVLGMKLIKRDDWGLIVGYRDDDLVCLTYHNKDINKPQVAENFPTVMCIIDDRPGYLNRVRSEIAAFETAEELYTGRDFGNFFNGLRGYKQWIKNLNNSKFLTRLNDEKFKEFVRANYWMYICMHDAKLSAIKYLKIIESNYDTKSKYITELHNLYQKEERFIRDGWEFVPSPKEIKYRKDWKMKTRRKQVEFIENLLGIEETCVDVLKRLNYGVFK